MSDDVTERIVVVQVERHGAVIGSLVKSFSGEWLATWNTARTPEHPYATGQRYFADYDAALAVIVSADDARRALPQ